MGGKGKRLFGCTVLMFGAGAWLGRVIRSGKQNFDWIGTCPAISFTIPVRPPNSNPTVLRLASLTGFNSSILLGDPDKISRVTV
jgi:hypothetical protein